jgi:hypothetical protein
MSAIVASREPIGPTACKHTESDEAAIGLTATPVGGDPMAGP